MKKFLMVTLATLGFSINVLAAPAPGDSYECSGENTIARFHESESAELRTLFFSHENNEWNLAGQGISVDSEIENESGFLISGTPVGEKGRVLIFVSEEASGKSMIEYSPDSDGGIVKHIRVSCQKNEA